jgi:glycerate 2-kinase
LYEAAVTAVDPERLVRGRFHRDARKLAVEGGSASSSWVGPTVMVGAGKASARMAAAAAEVLRGDLLAGAIVCPHGGSIPITGVECLEGGHPLPDTNGAQATQRLVSLLESQPDAAVLALISGGASSLLVQPTPPLTLSDKIATTQALLASGADIHEFNTVRKHLSRVKGGGLVRIARGRPLVALIISDVIGDMPSAIGSGPTAPDPTTYADALGVLERRDLLNSVPVAVVDHLHIGASGGLPETLKPGALGFQGVANFVIGSNTLALEAAASTAQQADYEAVVASKPLSGDTTVAAHHFAAWVLEMRRQRRGRLCLLAGGETTVRLDRTRGKGGRNQEFALVCAMQFAGTDLHLLSAATDGVDGPTNAAGAFANGSTLLRAQQLGLDGATMLARHDSYQFFDRVGDLFRPGPTGTNVMDIKIVLMDAPF